MRAFTGIELNDTVDLTSSVYKYTDYLLCHDDELEDRRIAFVLYLTEFDAHDGGTLELLSANGT